jgi:hypothetical protein
MVIKKILELFFGFICCGCVLAVLFFIMSDKGAEIVKDGLPLTPPYLYLVLIAGAMVSGLLSYLSGENGDKK